MRDLGVLRYLVCGERASLVGTDSCGGPEGLPQTGSLRTMAFLAAILRVPRARHVVMTAGRPSGMAATARATAILK